MSSSVERHPGTGRPEKGRKPGLLAPMANLLLVSACAYLIARAVFVTRGEYGLAGSVLVVLLLISEVFVMFHAITYVVDFVSSFSKKEPLRQEISDWQEAPSVAVLMPARHEPRQVLDYTLTCLENLDYPNKTIYFLDDSSDPKYQKEAEELAQAHGAKLFRRAVRHGAKAGILNDCIGTLKEKYVASFDADQNPIPGFLKETVALLEANPRLAFVQTPQFYTNIDASHVAFAANLQQSLFYEYICEGKSARGAMICCGTNMIIRREALLDVGGFDEKSITEDFSTSLDFHSHGWESIYDNRVNVFGSGPESLLAYLKQQWRWSRGNLGVLKKVIRYFFTRPRSLNFGQWWEYLATGSYYLVGWAYFFLMLCPITYVLFGVPSFFMRPEVYLLTFVPYFSLSMTLFYSSMGRRHYPPSRVFRAVLLGFLALPVYMMAAVGALFNLKTAFAVTQKAEVAFATPYRFVWPQVSLWLANFVALVWGVNRLLIELDLSILMSLVWIFYHFVLLSGLFYFRSEPAVDAVSEAA